ncbi:MAG: hypothetical protein SGILL_004374 [Bacillariaceae sp.]
MVPNAMDRAEKALAEMERSYNADKGESKANLTEVQEMSRTLGDTRQAIGPISLAYSSVIVGISRSKKRDMAQKADSILRRMKRNGAEPDVVVYTSVLNCWAKTASRKERKQSSTRVLSLLQEMEDAYTAEKNYLLKPSQITYSQAIKAIRHSLDPNAPRIAEGILKRMYNLTESGRIQVPPNVANYNAVITALSTSGPKAQRQSNARKAEDLLDDMIRRSRREGEFSVEPNIFTWGSVLRGWAESGSPDCGEQAHRVLERLEELYDSGNSRIRPNVVCYTTAMQAWARGDASPEMALHSVNNLLAKLEQLYIETGHDYSRPNEVTYITVMDSYCRKCPEEAGSMSQAVVEHMVKLHEKGIGFGKPTRIVFNALINAWSKSPEDNAAENAERVFQWMESEYHETASNGRGYVGKQSTSQPDEISLCGVLNAWANNAANGGALRAQQIMEYTTNVLTAKERGFDHSVVSYNVLIKAWGRSRAEDSVQRAEKILTDLEDNFAKKKSNIQPDITTYSSVINCCAYYAGPSKGRAAAFDVAWRTFRKIKESNKLVANNIVYGTLFKAIGKLCRTEDRDDMIKDLFEECCRAGQVCSFVLNQVRHSSPKELFRTLVLIPCSLKDKDASNVDRIFRKIPKAWKKNVAF